MLKQDFLINSLFRFDHLTGQNIINHIQILERTIILSFLSFDLYKLYQPSYNSLYKNIKNIDSKYHPLISKLEEVNLYILATEQSEELERLCPELIQFGKYLIIKRIMSQKVYVEKMSFMIDLIKNTDTSRVAKFTVLKYVRFCIEVSILSLNIYNKSIFVTKMEEPSLKLKSIVINKPKICEVEFPFVVVLHSKGLSLIFCMSRSYTEILRLYRSKKTIQKKLKTKDNPEKLKAHDLLKPKEKSREKGFNRSKKAKQKYSPPPTNPVKVNEKLDTNANKKITQKKKKQLLKVLMIQKEKVFSSMNHLCETFDNQTDILKMFLVKKKPSNPEKVKPPAIS